MFSGSILGLVIDAIIAVFILGCAVYNYKKGFASILINLLSLVISIVLVFILYKPVSNYVYEKTNISENIKSSVSVRLEEKIANQEVGQTEISGNGLIYSLVEKEAKGIVEKNKDNTINEVSNLITEKIITIGVFVFLFILIRLILFVLKRTVHILSKLPIIGFMNSLGGMVYGVIVGFLTIYVIFAILSLVFVAIGDNIILNAIDKSYIGNKMYYDNFLLKLIVR